MFALRTVRPLLAICAISVVVIGCFLDDSHNHESPTTAATPISDHPGQETPSNDGWNMEWEGEESEPNMPKEESIESGGLVGCYFNGIPLWGEVEVVDSFADIQVKVVGSFPDLRVEEVTSFPDECGQWEFVESFPDFTIEYVDSFPDITIEYVDSFPGI